MAQLIKKSTCNVGDLVLIPGLGRSPGEGNSYLFQYSGLKNSMNCMVHGVAKSWTRLSGFHFHYVPQTMLGTRERATKELELVLALLLVSQVIHQDIRYRVRGSPTSFKSD